MSLNYKVFIFTGKMVTRRADIEAACCAARGTVGNLKSLNPDYLVVGKRPGKRKLAFAENSSVVVISEGEFYTMCGLPVPVATPVRRKFSRLDTALAKLKPIAGTVRI